MGTLALVAFITGYDIVAKSLGRDTITAELRRNRVEAFIGIAWLAVHIAKRDD